VAHPLDIAIVGAGVAGLASAILLARGGHRVVVYERFATPKPLGSGLMMQPPGLAALARLGLRAELEALGQRIERIQGKTNRGRTIFDLAYGDLLPGLHAVAVHRAALHGVLWRGFKRSGSALETGVTVAAVDQRGTLVDEAGRALPAADLVIDASGARSPLRGFVCRSAARPYAYGAVWATVADIGVAQATLAQRYVDARIMIGYLPLGRSAAETPPVAALFWSLKPAEHAAWRAGFAAWRAQVAALWPALQPVLVRLDGPDALTLASYAHFTARTLVRGKVVLVGDAAHSTSPQLGQGANQGLIDAVVLADALAHAPDLGAALALYARLRRRHVRFYQQASAALTGFFQSDSWTLARARDLSFAPMAFIPYLRREMIRTLAGLKTGLLASQGPEQIVNCVPGADRQPTLAAE
jgi:2-polyprenyl-6-methoxyphenol hydroxylase-like FAD-dependent oxidoreductase